MEKKQQNREGVCEKIYKTIARNSPFRSNHRRSSSSEGSMSGNTRLFLKKLVSPYKPRPSPTQLNIPINSTEASITVDQEPKVAESSVSEQSNDRVIKITTTPKIALAFNPSLASGEEEKPRQKAEGDVPSSNIIVVHGPDQGSAATSVVPTNQKKPENGGAHHQYHSNYKYTNYIEYVKSQLGTKSNVSEEEEATIELETQPTTTTMIPPTVRDSFDDRASNYVNKTNSFR